MLCLYCFANKLLSLGWADYRLYPIQRLASDFRSQKEGDFPEWLQTYAMVMLIYIEQSYNREAKNCKALLQNFYAPES